MKRAHAHVPAIESLMEFLVGLQLDEGLASGPMPP